MSSLNCGKFLTVVLVVAITLYLYIQRSENMRNTENDKQQYVKESPMMQSVEQKFEFSDGQCHKGDPGLSDAWIKETFKEFLRVYDQKLGFNQGGSKLAHQFALYAMVKHLQPLHVIESGIYKGHGTWILRQAAPQAQLIMLDPNGGGLVYKDTKNSSLYMTGKAFKDFAQVDWKSMNLDMDRTLVFIDDHQSGIRRALEARNAGFRHLMFDDNYAIRQGDNYSFKMACPVYFNHTDYREEQFLDSFGQVKRQMTIKDVEVTRYVYDKGIETYFEFPTPWKIEETKRAVFQGVEYETLKSQYSGLCREQNWSSEYRNICYVKLADSTVDKTENDNMLKSLTRKTR